MAKDPIYESLRIGKHVFPGAWRYMFPREFLSWDFPEERKATCMDCPKAKFENYRPDYRCCTYHPRIPNFMLGLALEASLAKDKIQSLAQKRILTPEGTNFSTLHWIDYLKDMEEDVFGSSTRVLCPMLDTSNGYCTVHAFRNSVCSTFFCHNDHGTTGHHFWDQVQLTGSQVEIAISQWALEQIGFDLKAYIRRFNKLGKHIRRNHDRANRSLTLEAYEYLWGDWLGREADLFRACADQVKDHRDVLWEIAEDQEIIEASAYDRAALKMIPKALKEHVDEEDYEEGESVKPSEMWLAVKKAYRRLWQLPDKLLEINPKIVIQDNPAYDPGSPLHNHKACLLIVMKRKGGFKQDWWEYLTEEEEAFLRLFQKPIKAGWELLSSDEARKLKNPKGTLSEWYRRQILK